LEEEDRETIYSFVALSAHYIGLNVVQCRYLFVFPIKKEEFDGRRGVVEDASGFSALKLGSSVE